MSGVRSGRSVHGTERTKTDVVVIGSGAGGAAAAYELASAGLAVTVLEAGPEVRPDEFTQRELDTITRFYVDRGAQGPADGSIAILQGRMVGGSTVINGEVCFRIPDAVLDEWAREYRVTGMSVGEMKEPFEAVERMIHATPNEGRYLGSSMRMAEGLVKLGIEAKPLVRSVKDCHGCCYCFAGCAYGCKQSADRSYLPAAIAKGARVISEARVEKIALDGAIARGVFARTPEGALDVSARAVVIACGSVETPLMLLDHGLGGREVGRNLALHPAIGVLGWYDEDQTEYRNAMLSSYSDAFVKDGFLIELGAGSPAFIAPSVPGFGRAHKEMARELHKASLAAAIVRDEGASGRVRRGRRGEKVIEYVTSPQTRERARSAIRKLGNIAFASGARKVTVGTVVPFEARSVDDLRAVSSLPVGPGDVSFISYHPQGTARLGVVTDLDGAVRDVRGLYVMDASLFPSPVGVNTQEPVMGVATVLARRLASKLTA